MERGASALQLNELKQTREQLESLKLELKSTQSECTRVEEELSEASKASDCVRNQHKADMGRMQDELDAMKQKCLALEKQVKALQVDQSALETAKRENCERINDLSGAGRVKDSNAHVDEQIQRSLRRQTEAGE